MSLDLPTPDAAPLTPAPPTPAKDRMVLLATAAMRARRRPAAIALLWGYELLLAALLAWPAGAYVEGVYGGHPQGDAALFRPGALALMDLLARARPVMSALGAHVSPLLGVGVVLGLFPLALLVVQIAHATPSRRAPPLVASLARAWAMFPRLFALMLALGLAQLLILVGGVLAAGAIAESTTTSLGEARAQQLGIVVFLLFGALVASAGVLHDVARTAAIRFDVGPLRAARLAANALRRGWVGLLWSWGWRLAIGWLPVVMAAALSARLAGRGVAAFLALALMHQLVVLARVALRASWLAKALRVVDGTHRVVRAPK